MKQATLLPSVGKGQPTTHDVISEGSTGCFLRTGLGDSPANEWFPYHSQHGYSVRLSDDKQVTAKAN